MQVYQIVIFNQHGFNVEIIALLHMVKLLFMRGLGDFLQIIKTISFAVHMFFLKKLLFHFRFILFLFRFILIQTGGNVEKL